MSRIVTERTVEADLSAGTGRRGRSAAPVPGPDVIPPETLEFYRTVMNGLLERGVPFMVGGAYALYQHAGIERHTRDLDLFVRRATLPLIESAAREMGYEAREFSPHWLWKITTDVGYVDLIYGSGNGAAPVDEQWFEHAVEGEVFGIPVPLIPAEEMIWSKSYIMERERFDGADVAHILHRSAETLDWNRLMSRFESHWRVLLSHLVMFGFIYPGHRARLPAPVMRELQTRLGKELESNAVGPLAELCGGTVVSRSQYLIDTRERGFRDGRLPPFGAMSPSDIAAWTRLAEEEARASMPFAKTTEPVEPKPSKRRPS